MTVLNTKSLRGNMSSSKRYLPKLLPLAITVLFTACSNSTLIKSQDLSASSIAYTETVNELLDETINNVINVDSKELVRTRQGKNRYKKLKERNKSLKALIGEINRFRHQTTLMNSYFLNLQALADSTVKDDVGVNLGRISSRIKYMNNRPRNDDDEIRINRLLTEKEEGYISKIGSLIIGSYYAARIEAALRRDAPIIGKLMLLQEKELNNIVNILRDRLDAGSRIHLIDEVVGPFVNLESETFEKNTWIDNRRKFFEMQQAAQIFSNVKEAQKGLRFAWEDILRGKKDIGEVDNMLSDVNGFLSTLHALDQSRSKNNQFNSHLAGE